MLPNVHKKTSSCPIVLSLYRVPHTCSSTIDILIRTPALTVHYWHLQVHPHCYSWGCSPRADCGVAWQSNKVLLNQRMCYVMLNDHCHNAWSHCFRCPCFKVIQIAICIDMVVDKSCTPLATRPCNWENWFDSTTSHTITCLITEMWVLPSRVENKASLIYVATFISSMNYQKKSVLLFKILNITIIKRQLVLNIFQNFITCYVNIGSYHSMFYGIIKNIHKIHIAAILDLFKTACHIRWNFCLKLIIILAGRSINYNQIYLSILDMIFNHKIPIRNVFIESIKTRLSIKTRIYLSFVMETTNRYFRKLVDLVELSFKVSDPY